jgi:alginate O-acetyltransferase complex protein AlgI
MLFNSLNFIILFLVTFLVYYLPIFKKLQVPILIIASFIFYANHNPELLILLIASISVNVVTSYFIQFGTLKFNYLIALLGVVINLATLAYFKYAALFANTFLDKDNELFETLVSIPLPIGISFFTFQGVSLMVDTYRNRDNKTGIQLIQKNVGKHVLNTFFYISFFPQLIAGPIVKAYEFLPQIKPKFIKDINWERCVKNLILGYFLKMVVADNMKDFTFNIQYPYFTELASSELLILLIGYSVQIFADFAAYSILAIGIAGFFGYVIPINFNYPYISKTFSEFWRRWHISLSTFLKEYLYIPLGGNRKGSVRTYLNLFITMTLGGIWHGAAWSYAIWGMYHGLLLCLERLFGKQTKTHTSRSYKVMKIALVFSAVTLGWLLFKLPEFSEVILYMKALFSNQFMPKEFHLIIYVFIYTIPVLLYHLLYLSKIKGLRILTSNTNYEPIGYAVMLFLIITNYGSSNTFIYFQF